MTKVLCVADYDYVKSHQFCIDSHRKYCKKNNYEYVLISGDKNSRNWKRSKVDELIDLLYNFNDDVLLIDADCFIKENTPEFLNFLTNKSIYFVKGKSKRLNSGFLYFKNNDKSKKFLLDLKERLKTAIPKGRGYFVTKEGENGHIIWLKADYEMQGKHIFQEISFHWNCSLPKLEDKAHVLHFTNDLRKRIHKYRNE